MSPRKLLAENMFESVSGTNIVVFPQQIFLSSVILWKMSFVGVHRTSSLVRYPAGFQKNARFGIRPDFWQNPAGHKSWQIV